MILFEAVVWEILLFERTVSRLKMFFFVFFFFNLEEFFQG